MLTSSIFRFIRIFIFTTFWKASFVKISLKLAIFLCHFTKIPETLYVFLGKKIEDEKKFLFFFAPKCYFFPFIHINEVHGSYKIIDLISSWIKNTYVYRLLSQGEPSIAFTSNQSNDKVWEIIPNTSPQISYFSNEEESASETWSHLMIR